MKEGEPVLGGPQVAPGSTPMSNVGPQPAASGTSPTPRSDFSSFQSGPQPSTGPSLTSTQPNPSVSPTTPQSIPRLTNRFSDRPTSTGSPQTSYINSNPPNMQYTGPAPVQPPMQYQPQMIASNNTGDIVLSGPAPQKSKKGLIAVIVLVMLALTAAIVTLVVINQNSGGTLFGVNPQQEAQPTKEEVYNMLQNFNTQHYSELIDTYDNTIGLVPNLKPDEYTAILPYAQYAEYFTQSINDSTESYNEIKSNIPDHLRDGDIDLQPAKDEIDQSLEAMKYNIDLLDKFYQAYYAPLAQDVKPNTCSKTQNMIDLEQNSNTSAAAEAYYLVYCKVVNFLNSNEDPAVFQDTIAAPTATSATLLNELLIEVPSATNTIENLLEELAQ